MTYRNIQAKNTKIYISSHLLHVIFLVLQNVEWIMLTNLSLSNGPPRDQKKGLVFISFWIRNLRALSASVPKCISYRWLKGRTSWVCIPKRNDAKYICVQVMSFFFKCNFAINIQEWNWIYFTITNWWWWI